MTNKNNLQPIFLSSPHHSSSGHRSPSDPSTLSPNSTGSSSDDQGTHSSQSNTDRDKDRDSQTNSTSPPYERYPRPIRLRKGTRLEDAYPSIFAGLGDKDPDPSSLLASLESPFQLQEYIAHLVRADPHAVGRIVKLPSHLIQRDVWIYEQLRRLAHDLGHPLVSALQADCNRAKCPEMKAGEWLYLCAAHATASEDCCAIDYIVHTLDGATALLNSARYFPSRIQIPASSIKHFTSIARRLYRILAHAWFHHRELFEECESETSLYARFLALTDEFGLMSEDLLVIPRGAEEDGGNNESLEEGEEVEAENENEIEGGPEDQQQPMDDEADDNDQTDPRPQEESNPLDQQATSPPSSEEHLNQDKSPEKGSE